MFVLNVFMKKERRIYSVMEMKCYLRIISDGYVWCECMLPISVNTPKKMIMEWGFHAANKNKLQMYEKECHFYYVTISD